MASSEVNPDYTGAILTDEQNRRIVIDKIIASGGFSVVGKAKFENGEESFAVKIEKDSSEYDDHQEEIKSRSFLRETIV